MKKLTSIEKISKINEVTKDESDKELVTVNNKLATLSTEYLDHLIGAIEDFRKSNSRYPREIIMNEDMGKKYFNYFVNTEPMHFKYKGAYMMSITVNTRFRASTMFMK